MEKARYTLVGIVVGAILGVAAAPVSTRLQASTWVPQSSSWSAYHAAIPAPAREEEPAPTF